ncbi:MAG: hypothetical protein ABJ004_04110 [Cyclobacteriaceae bacterium]
MKGTLKLLAALSIILISVSCSDDEPKVDPIVGLWELDDVAREIEQSGFTYLEYENENDIFGESAYTIEFKSDFTFERILEDVAFSDGSTSDLEEEGEWELDGDELDFDAEDDEYGGLGYSFDVLEVTATNLTLSYGEDGTGFPDSKVDDWLADGTVTSSGQFTVTQEEYDSLVLNFSESIDVVYILEFDKE